MKHELRIRFRALRDAVPAGRRQAAAEKIAATLFELPEFQEARVVLFYASFGSEVPTSGMMEAAARQGKLVALPRITGKALHLYRWSPGSPLLPNRQGVPEPHASEAEVAADSVDLVVVPGLAFDRRGSRLGYGGGYYDRLLKAAPKAFRVGVGYEVQLVPSLPSTHMDVPMDWLVTEEGVHPLPRRPH